MEKEAEYTKNCDNLRKIIQKTGEPLEGNCMYKHLSFDIWDCLLNKRINYQKIVKGKKRVCEIGFNGGHSVLAMLLANPDAQYVLFDLGVHTYSRPCFEYIKSIFPTTDIEIFWGNSCETVPAYHEKYPEVLFDVVHIDGSHKSEVYSEDWLHSLEITSSGSFIIFDDSDNKKISNFIDAEISKDVVNEDFTFLPTSGYEHRILVRK